MIKNNKRKYFTLLELVIVIVVIGILTGMALPKFTGVVKNSKVAAMITDIDTLEKAIIMYQQDNDTLPLLEETKTFGLQRLSEDNMTDIYPSLQEALKLSEDSEEYLYKIDLDESGKYHSKTKYGHSKTQKDFYVYSTKSNNVYYYGYLKDGDDKYNHNEIPIIIENNELVKKIPSKPIGDTNTSNPSIKPTFNTYYSSNNRSSIANSFITTQDGGYLFVGTNYDKASIVKYNKDGEIEFDKDYALHTTNYGTYFKSVEEIDKNKYVVVGSIDNKPTLFIMDGEGNITMQKQYSLGETTEFIDVKYIKDEGFIMAGYTSTATVPPYTIMVDLNGKILWQKEFGSKEYSSIRFNNIIELKNGNIAMVGTEWYKSGKKYYNRGIIYIVDKNGTSINYYSKVGICEAYYNDVYELEDGNLLVLVNYGSTIEFTNYSGSNTSAAIIFDQDLNIVKEKNFGKDFLYLGKFDKVGDDFIAVGHSTKYTPSYNSDMRMIKFNSNLEELDKAFFDGSKNDNYTGIKATSDGGFVTIANSSSNDGDFTDAPNTLDKVILRKYSKNSPLK